MNLNAAKKFVGGLALAGAFALTGVVGFAQQTGQDQNDGHRGGERGWNREGRGGRERGEGREGGLMGRFAEKLNLTDAQKAQMQQIADRFRETATASTPSRAGLSTSRPCARPRRRAPTGRSKWRSPAPARCSRCTTC